MATVLIVLVLLPLLVAALRLLRHARLLVVCAATMGMAGSAGGGGPVGGNGELMVVAVESLVLRTCPAVTCPSVGSLQAGAEIRPVGHRGDWVRLAGDLWLHGGYLDPVSGSAGP